MKSREAGKQESNLPRLAVTMGDPAGIGPEIVLKALTCPDIRRLCAPTVYGDVAWMRRTAQEIRPDVRIEEETDYWRAPESSGDREGTVWVRQATHADLGRVIYGAISAEAGRAAAESVIAAAGAAMGGKTDALVTAPLHKEAIALAGFSYPGHTELLAAVTGTERYGMLLVADALRVVHVSTHVALREAVARVRAGRVLECIRLGEAGCRMLGIAAPRIAVAALNPHAGEGGLFGTEEEREIAPAVRLAQQEGRDVTGPYPPDTVFARAVRGEFDLVVAMYHDQGHIPVKLHGFDTGINMTLGLPVLRVSVDHGTAFDIAGRGVASERSLSAALRLAAHIVRAQGEHHAA